MVDQDFSRGDGNGFLGRFQDAFHRYSALFDALRSMQDSMSQDRYIVEKQVLEREIKNIVAVGGPKRRDGQQNWGFWERRCPPIRPGFCCVCSHGKKGRAWWKRVGWKDLLFSLSTSYHAPGVREGRRQVRMGI
ncbi:hypothetical protein AMTRI_Chr05g68850 [Amborella trichopoda]